MAANKRFCTLIISSILFAALLFAGIALAQSGLYEMPWWSVDGGSGTVETDSGYALSGTIGQADSMISSPSDSDTFTLGLGFWNEAVLPGSAVSITLTTLSGYNNIYLEWNPTDDPYVMEYRVSRTISGTLPLAPIVTIPDTFYADYDPTLVSGTAYCYQVEALRSGGSVAKTSNQACAVVGQLDLWIPDLWAAPGDSAYIPVNIRNADGLQIAAADIWLEFDDAILSVTGVERTILTIDYTWDYAVVPNLDGLDQVRINTYWGADPPMLYGAGGLVWIQVQVIGPENSQSPLNLSEYIQGVGGTAIFAPDDLYEPIPTLFENSVFHVEHAGPYRLGDLNGDGVVSTIDAVIALQIASGQIIPTPEQEYAGDVNGDGLINSADASMILYYATHGTWPIPENILLAPQSTASNPVAVSLDDASGAPGDVVEAALRLADVTSWAAGDFTVVYDRAVVSEVAGVRVSGMAGSFRVEYNDLGNGLLLISTADKTPITGSDAVLIISFQISPNAARGSSSPLLITATRLYDNYGRDFERSALQYTIERVGGQLTVDAGYINFLPLVVR